MPTWPYSEAPGLCPPLSPPHACVLNHFCRVQLISALWTVTRQAPLSKGFSRQERWRGLPCPPPGDLPHPGTKPVSPALVGGFFTTEPPGKPLPLPQEPSSYNLPLDLTTSSRKALEVPNCTCSQARPTYPGLTSTAGHNQTQVSTSLLLPRASASMSGPSRETSLLKTLKLGFLPLFC